MLKFSGASTIGVSDSLSENTIMYVKLSNREFPNYSKSHKLTLRLRPGVHLYRFYVDGQWRVIPDQACVKESDGTENNVVHGKFPLWKWFDITHFSG